MSFKRYAPRPYVAVQPVKQAPDPRGPTYGMIWTAVGPTFEAHRQRLSGTERFAYGATATKIIERLTCDLPPPVTQAQRVRFGTETPDYNVFSIVSYPSRGVAIIEIERL